MPIRHRVMACLASSMMALTVVGCGTKDLDKPLPDAASMVDGIEVWDLRERPDAEAVGIDDGETAIYETRPDRPVTFHLAGGAELRMSVRYVSFSAISSADASPNSVEAHSGSMPLDDLVNEYLSVLEQLDLPTDSVAQFKEEAASATAAKRVGSDREEARFGDLKLGVFARYSPNGETGLVVVNGGWPDSD